MIRLFLLISISVSLKYCFPINSKISDNHLIQTNVLGIREKLDAPLFKSRTLTPYTIQQYWKAKGEMKVAFLKFLIFNLRVLIRLVSAIFGLKPSHRQRYPNPYDPNNAMNSDFNRNYPQINDLNTFPFESNQMSVAYKPIKGSYINRPYYHQDQYLDYDYNDFQFQLLPEDFSAKSKQTLMAIFNWFYSLFLKLNKLFWF